MMRRLALALCALVMVAGCQTLQDVELPDHDASGADKMKRSPCVCVDLNYQPEAFKWRQS